MEFLVSANWTTGTVIPLDGGFLWLARYLKGYTWTRASNRELERDIGVRLVNIQFSVSFRDDQTEYKSPAFSLSSPSTDFACACLDCTLQLLGF